MNVGVVSHFALRKRDLIRLPSWIRWLLVDHPSTTNEHAGEREDCRHKPQERPRRLGKPAKPAEVQFRQPEQAFVGKTVSRIEQKQGIERLRKRKVDSREHPYRYEAEKPEAERAMQVPVDPRE